MSACECEWAQCRRATFYARVSRHACAPPSPFLGLPRPPPCVQVCTSKMNLSDEVDLEDYVSRPDKISAAEVRGRMAHSLLRELCVQSGFPVTPPFLDFLSLPLLPSHFPAQQPSWSVRSLPPPPKKKN